MRKMRGLLSIYVRDREPVVHCLDTAEALSAAARSLWWSSICGIMCMHTHRGAAVNGSFLINGCYNTRLILETITSWQELIQTVRESFLIFFFIAVLQYLMQSQTSPQILKKTGTT